MNDDLHDVCTRNPCPHKVLRGGTSFPSELAPGLRYQGGAVSPLVQFTSLVAELYKRVLACKEGKSAAITLH